MGSRIECFLVEPSGIFQQSLRRYSRHGECPNGYHDASARLGDVLPPSDGRSRGGDGFDHADPRWPKSCACGYAFVDTDYWQHNIDEKWRRQGTAELYPLASAPVGAIWFAPWMEPAGTGPDGRALVVRTPGGDWLVDKPSRDGTPWTRTGTPPLITVRPSILFYTGDGNEPSYHAFLTDGVLVEC